MAERVRRGRAAARVAGHGRSTHPGPALGLRASGAFGRASLSEAEELGAALRFGRAAGCTWDEPLAEVDVSATFCRLFFSGACSQVSSASSRTASASSFVAAKNGPRPEPLRAEFLPPPGMVASTFADQRAEGRAVARSVASGCLALAWRSCRRTGPVGCAPAAGLSAPLADPQNCRRSPCMRTNRSASTSIADRPSADRRGVEISWPGVKLLTERNLATFHVATLTVSFVGAASSRDLRPVHRALASCRPSPPEGCKRLVKFIPVKPLIPRFWTDPVSTHAGPSSRTVACSIQP